MASFREVLKERRKAGSGIISSLSSAAIGTTRESVDIRNTLFKTGSILNALFPKVKGYSAIDRAPKIKSSSTSPTSLMSDAGSILVNEKLNIISKNTEISAKNSVVLPKMAYDTNLMRLNLTRLASALTGKASRGPDAFFAAAKERENIYERQFGKTATTPTAITQTGTKEQGFFSSILKSLGGNLISMLIKGGLIAGLLTAVSKYFSDPEFKESVNGIIEKALGFIFGPDFKQKFQEKFEEILNDISLGLLGAIAAFAGVKFIVEAFKVALVGLELALLKAQAALGTAGLLGALGPILALGGLAYGLYKLIKSDKKVTSTLDEAEKSGWTPEQSSITTTEPMTTDEMVSGIRKGGLAGVLDDKASEKEYENETRKFLRQQSPPSKPVNPTSPTPITGDGVSLLNSIMDKEGITDANVRNRIMNLAQIESTLNPNARGPIIQSGMHKGDQAHGLLQIMPKTAEEMGFSRTDIQDPEKAATAGVRYFMKNYKSLGNLDAATIAHHAGPGKGKEFLQTGSVSTVDVGTGLKTMDYLTRVSGTTRASGSSISSASVMASEGRMTMAAAKPVVINAPTTNVQQGSMGGGGSAPVGVVDTDFMKYLVGRTITI